MLTEMLELAKALMTNGSDMRTRDRTVGGADLGEEMVVMGTGNPGVWRQQP
jgi:hypothetical protein